MVTPIIEKETVPTHAPYLTKGDGSLDDTAILVRRLRARGQSFAEIGEWLGVHWRTIYRWGRGENHPWQPVAINQLLAQMLAKSQK